MVDALSSARYLIYLSYGDERYSLTHLKLQKLLYLAQGWSYVWDDRPLFLDDFVAWQYGPVCQKVYHYFRKYGSEEIPEAEGCSHLNDNEARGTIDAVWKNFGGYSARDLVNMTHQQPVWKEAFPSRSIISKERIRDYYRSAFL